MDQHDVSVGGQLLKTQGKTFHYDVSAEAWVAGSRAGQVHVDGHATLVSHSWEILFSWLRRLSSIVLPLPSIWVSTLVSITCGIITSVRRYTLVFWVSSL